MIRKGSCLLLGDIMLDRYSYGCVERISPESPCPVFLRDGNEDEYAGGAAHVGVLLSGCGWEVYQAGCVGTDAEGGHLLNLLADAGVDDYRYMLRYPGSTILKNRLVDATGQCHLRLDRDYTVTLSDAVVSDMLESIRHASCKENYGMLISDYNKGTLTPDIICRMLTACRDAGIFSLVDIKSAPLAKYRGACVLKGNRCEWSVICGIADDTDTLVKHLPVLKAEACADNVVITLGAEGMAGIDINGRVSVIEGICVPDADVTGAGDVVSAVLYDCMMGGETLESAMRKANICAAATVRNNRYRCGHRCEVSASAPRHCKWVSIEELLSLRQGLGRIVFTNGCFDILHRGHVDMLCRAAQSGDTLVVGLNSDASVRALKGDARPINDLSSRVGVLSALECVDYIVTFDEQTPLSLIKALCPDVLVKGGDYVRENIVGAHEVLEYGGQVVTIPIKYNISTSEVIKRLMDEEG